MGEGVDLQAEWKGSKSGPTPNGSHETTQVDVEFGRLADANTRLHEAIEALLGRLEPTVLRASEPSGQVPAEAEPRYLVPLAERIRQEASGVEAGALRLADILARLEV